MILANMSTQELRTGVPLVSLKKPAAAALLYTAALAPSAWGAPASFETCTDYHCDILKPVTLRKDQWKQVRQQFRGVGNAVTEREQIRQAIALLEELVGEQAGTSGDLEKNQGDGSHPGQLDCISESLNTTTYLRLIEEDNLLQWHLVEERQQRDEGLFGWGTHWTAVIQEHGSGQQFAVDSWVDKNGKPPLVQKIENWIEKRPE